MLLLGATQMKFPSFWTPIILGILARRLARPVRREKAEVYREIKERRFLIPHHATKG